MGAINFVLCLLAQVTISHGSPPPDSFPIEKYYSRTVVLLNARGEGIFSKASKAFILWRQRTPPWIADEVFSSHYISDEDLRCSFILATEKSSEEPRLQGSTAADLEALGISTLEGIFSKMIGTRTTRVDIFSKYLVMNLEGHVTFFFWPKGIKSSKHAKIQSTLTDIFPGAITEGAGDVRIQITMDDSGKMVDVDFTLINVDAWINHKKDRAGADLVGALEKQIQSLLQKGSTEIARVTGFGLNHSDD